MRVLFLGLVVSDLHSSSALYPSLIHEFHRNGHEIVVVAPALEGMQPGLHVEGEIQVVRIKTLKLFGVGKFYKGIANLLLPLQYYRALLACKMDLDFDLVLIPTPPITLYPLARKIKRKFGSKVYLILRDIFPQNAVDLKMMREGGAAHRFFRAQEKGLYKICDGIGCMSPGNAEYILRHNPSVPTSVVHQLPNWKKLGPYPVHDEDALVREKYGFGNKFVVLFGGNIGRPQKMENIVALAKACKDQDDIFFAIFGEGTEKQMLIDLIKKSGLSNIRVFDGVSGKEYMRILQVADVGLISLSEDFTIPNTPSKVLAYFNAKKPILAAIDLNTDIGQILETVGAGVWAEANKPNELKTLLLKLYQQPELRKEMGENGYRYLLESLTPEIAYETVIRAINN